jgi:hypothetical protein
VDEGRRILGELQARGVADRNLDYDEVMAELAEGRHAMSVISSRRHEASFGWRFESGDRQLIDDLTAVARGPFLAMASPAAPAIPVGRLTADFERTTGKVLDLALRWEQYPTDGMWVCDVSIDRNNKGSCGVNVDDDDDDPEGCLVTLADRLCEGWFARGDLGWMADVPASPVSADVGPQEQRRGRMLALRS